MISSRVLNFKYIAVLLSSVILMACSDEANHQSGDGNKSSSINGKNSVPYIVDETFAVGEGVYVRALAYDAERKSMWIGTSSGVHEIATADRSLKQTFTRDHGLANEYVFAIGIDDKGNKWFGTNAGGVSRYKEGEWKTYFPMHGLADYWVYSFAQQDMGDFWIGTWAGVNRYRPSTGEMTTYVKELVNEWVYGIDVDSKDRVWFGTEGGVSMFDGNVWKEWTHDDGIGAKNKDGLEASTNTGLGTRQRHDLGVLRGGLATYNPNYVFTISVNQDDSVWVGTWGGGVSVYRENVWKSYTVDDGLAGNIVYSSLIDNDGNMWFGTNNGISYFDGSNWVNLSVHNGLLGRDVYALESDQSGNIWVGTRAGVSIVRKATN